MTDDVQSIVRGLSEAQRAALLDTGYPIASMGPSGYDSIIIGFEHGRSAKALHRLGLATLPFAPQFLTPPRPSRPSSPPPRTREERVMENKDPWLCCGCGDPVGDDGFSTCFCGTNALFKRGSCEYGIKKRPCAWCGAHEFRAELDGDNLCLECCHKWVRGEGMAARARSRKS